MLIFLSRDTLQWSSAAMILNDLCRRYVKQSSLDSEYPRDQS